MASLAQKIQCEAHVRDMLQSQGMPPPDEVEYGHGCIRLFFHQPKVVLVVDIDDYTEVDDEIARRHEFAAADPGDPATDTADLTSDEDRGPPFMTFPFPGPGQRN